MKDVFFLTSNKQKADDFKKLGLGVKEFNVEIPEVLSSDVEVVVLHKAKDTKLNNIVVEDTSLEVESAGFYGTQIKHMYETVKDNAGFHGKEAIWRVSVSMKKDDTFYISTGELKGILKYPPAEFGYHFDRIFSIMDINKDYIQYATLSEEDRIKCGPRFKAIEQLVNAINTDDYSKLKKVKESDIEEWCGDYQIELQPVKLKIN
jgi:inosine/xanthosine triphosphate pyrophosphatase family protein